MLVCWVLFVCTLEVQASEEVNYSDVPKPSHYLHSNGTGHSGEFSILFEYSEKTGDFYRCFGRSGQAMGRMKCKVIKDVGTPLTRGVKDIWSYGVTPDQLVAQHMTTNSVLSVLNPFSQTVRYFLFHNTKENRITKCTVAENTYNFDTYVNGLNTIFMSDKKDVQREFCEVVHPK